MEMKKIELNSGMRRMLEEKLAGSSEQRRTSHLAIYGGVHP